MGSGFVVDYEGTSIQADGLPGTPAAALAFAALLVEEQEQQAEADRAMIEMARQWSADER